MNKKQIIISVIIAAIILFLMKDKIFGALNLKSKNMPRGLRNNNIGNIKISASNWKGKVPKEENTDGVFEQFVAKKYGDRALLKLLYTYYSKYDLNTIREILNRYAPNSENETSSYVQFVSDRMGMNADSGLNLKDKSVLFKLAESIGYFENGQKALSQSEFEEAYAIM